MRIEIATPDFFALSAKKLRIEEVAETGRVYFIFRDRIVAVGVNGEQRG
jgi:hypothetical protein